jgi:hypothetical protein
MKILTVSLFVILFLTTSDYLQAACELPSELRRMDYDTATESLREKCETCSSACAALGILEEWRTCQIDSADCNISSDRFDPFEKKVERRKLLGLMSNIRRSVQQERQIAENKRLDDLDAASKPPPLNRETINKALHGVYSGNSKLSNGTIATILKVDPEIFSHCDDTHCYIMGGVLKTRFDLIDDPDCKQSGHVATCKVDFRLDVESTLSNSGGWRNDMLRGAMALQDLTGRGSLTFKRQQWQFETFFINQL